MKSGLRLGVALVGACMVTGACSESKSPVGGFAVEVAPLELDGITNARYTVSVSAGGKVVWSRTIDADRFGDGEGGVAYVGPCDADPLVQPNTVTVVLEALEVDGEDVPASTWQNPTPVFKEVECRANADTAVSFDLVVMRQAEQGFFDVAVSFKDLFCSAKFDCVPELLHDGPERALTGVLAFACAAGPGEDTTLYMTDVTLDCPGRDPVVLNPSMGAGQHRVEDELVFAAGSYFGQEGLAGLDKCYWNTAIGLSFAVGEVGSNPAGCRVKARGTAAQGNLGALSAGRTPVDTRYPVVVWDVPVTDLAGQFVCDAHGLNTGDGAVTTSYTTLSGEGFRWPYECGDKPRLTCAGETAEVAGADLIVDEVDGMVEVRVGSALTRLRLPGGVQLDRQAGCCIDACCTE